MECKASNELWTFFYEKYTFFRMISVFRYVKVENEIKEENTKSHSKKSVF